MVPKSEAKLITSHHPQDLDFLMENLEKKFQQDWRFILDPSEIKYRLQFDKWALYLELSVPKVIISKAKHLKDSLPIWVKSD